MYRVRTTLHETLHNTGVSHDWRDEELRSTGSWAMIPACGGTNGRYGAGGTAASAETSVRFFECTEDYCYAFKDAAKGEFKAELEYSLKADPRRFSGQCATWSARLGVSFD